MHLSDVQRRGELADGAHVEHLAVRLDQPAKTSRIEKQKVRFEIRLVPVIAVRDLDQQDAAGHETRDQCADQVVRPRHVLEHVREHDEIERAVRAHIRKFAERGVPAEALPERIELAAVAFDRAIVVGEARVPHRVVEQSETRPPVEHRGLAREIEPPPDVAHTGETLREIVAARARRRNGDFAVPIVLVIGRKLGFGGLRIGVNQAAVAAALERHAAEDVVRAEIRSHRVRAVARAAWTAHRALRVQRRTPATRAPADSGP